MDKPKPSAVAAAASISLSYASMLLNGDRPWTARIAIDVYRVTGWRPAIIAAATEAEIDALDKLTPTRARRPESAAA